MAIISSDNHKPKRVLICWEHVTGYIEAWLKAMLGHGVELMVVQRSGGEKSNLAYESQIYKNCSFINIALLNEREIDGIITQIVNFDADIAFISISRSGAFREIASKYRRSGKIVVGCSDHFWKGDLRDRLKSLLFKMGVYSDYEAIWGPGALARIYARNLGFQDQVIFDGLYSSDTSLFQQIGVKRHKQVASEGWPHAFFYVGQYIHRKGIDTLLNAYSEYRKSVDEPWELWCAGNGPEKKALQNTAGVTDLGFISPAECAETMGKAGAFCLPSREDHWPLVIHEAVNAGLPVIASSRCGSVVECVQSGINGMIFPSGDVSYLASAMRFISESGRAREMGRESLRISFNRTSESVARTALVDIPFLLRGNSLIEDFELDNKNS